jgi:hypothetical protein
MKDGRCYFVWYEIVVVLPATPWLVFVISIPHKIGIRDLCVPECEKMSDSGRK